MRDYNLENEKITCPHCGNEVRDLQELVKYMDHEEYDFNCGYCDKPIEGYITVSYDFHTYNEDDSGNAFHCKED